MIRILLCWLGWVSVLSAQETATVFIPTADIPTSKLLATIAGDEAKVTQVEKAETPTVEIAWPDVRIILKADPAYDHQKKVGEMLDWIARFPEEDQQQRATQNLVQQVIGTRQALMCEIHPGFDDDGHATRFLTQLAREQKGWLQAHQSLYNAEGYRILGLPGTPLLLQGSAMAKIKTEDLLGTWRVNVEARNGANGVLTYVTGEETRTADGRYTAKARMILLVAPDQPPAIIAEISDIGTWKIEDYILVAQPEEIKVLSLKANIRDYDEQAFKKAIESTDNGTHSQMYRMTTDVYVGENLDGGTQTRYERSKPVSIK